MDRRERAKINSANAAKSNFGWWTEARVDTLRASSFCLRTAEEIAAAIGDGCTRNAVIGKARRLGIPLRPSVRSIAAVNRAFWTDKRLAELRQLAAAEFSISGIACALSCKRCMVERKAKVLGIKINARPRAAREMKAKWLRWRIAKLQRELDALEREGRPLASPCIAFDVKHAEAAQQPAALGSPVVKQPSSAEVIVS